MAYMLSYRVFQATVFLKAPLTVTVKEYKGQGTGEPSDVFIQVHSVFTAP